MNPAETEARKAVEVMKSGGIILYPTDTVWGIGCDACNEEAVKKVLALKGRSSAKGLVLLLDIPGRLQSFVREIPGNAWDLIEFSERPLTIVFETPVNLAASALAADGSVGIRVTRDAFCSRLSELLRKPIVSTSANFSGKPVPESFSAIEDSLVRGVDYVVNLRRNEQTKSRPSTVLRMRTNGQIEFLRP
ncbi:MAG: hypothetical protein RL213_649 [Bacteroidota bacterium]|jgi:L-threonylcarbamoyladenylate synthase